ncbi:MAG: hypothetical protein IKA51_01100 [Clostridia bacterium]|nr:hypothetical protein [Clostridia bacterium]
MDFLKNWISAIAVSSLLLGILNIITPSEKTARLIRAAASVYLAVLIFSPIINGDLGFELSSFKKTLSSFDFSSSDEITSNEKGLSAAKLAVEAELKERLLSKKISVYSLETVISQKNGEYNLIAVKLNCSNEEAARRILCDELEISEDIIIFW